MTKLREANQGLQLSAVSLVMGVMNRWSLCSSSSAVVQWRANVVQYYASVQGARDGAYAMRTASQHGGASVLVIVLRQWQRRVVRQAVLQMRENWVVTCMQILLQGKFSQQSDAMRQEMQKQSGVLAVRQLVRRSHRVGALQSLLCWKLNAAGTTSHTSKMIVIVVA